MYNKRTRVFAVMQLLFAGGIGLVAFYSARLFCSAELYTLLRDVVVVVFESARKNNVVPGARESTAGKREGETRD